MLFNNYFIRRVFTQHPSIVFSGCARFPLQKSFIRKQYVYLIIIFLTLLASENVNVTNAHVGEKDFVGIIAKGIIDHYYLFSSTTKNRLEIIVKYYGINLTKYYDIKLPE